MLLTQFKEVSKIDTQIQRIHRDLAQLYKRRDALMQAKGNGNALPVAVAPVPLEKEYDRLVAIWQQYGLKPPTYKYLKPALARATGILRDMVAAKPELQGYLSLVLVPPSKELQQALAQRSSVQQFVQAADSADPAVPRPAIHLKWRLFVMHTGREGLAWASARTLLADQLYMIAGHDARALGRSEYIALTLHRARPMDQENWTMLLRDADIDTELLPCVTFDHGRYCYNYDDLDNIFGDNRFRPAVEV